MKKYIVFSALLAGLFLSSSLICHASVGKTMRADVQAIRIPAGTTMQLEVLDSISSRTQSMGDEFSAMLLDDKIVGGQVALPAGSVIRGTINYVVPAKKLSRSAIVYFGFDHVVTPTGKQIPISAGLYRYKELTLDGGVYSGGNYGYAVQENWKQTKKLYNKIINWGKSTGDNLQYLCVPVGAVGGVFGGAFYYVGSDIVDLFKKGNDVNLTQGTNLEIMLTKPLDIPLH